MITHRFVETNGIRMHIAEAGTGPLVVLCHGWPESWYSWRHQIEALAKAGFHAVAPDMRGYGQTDKPDAIDSHTLFHLTGDIIGLVQALGEKQATVIGHDWGAPVAWHCALFRPDIFRNVVGLSVPYRPRGSVKPSTAWPSTDDAEFYQSYFQRPGEAEAEFDKDVRNTILLTLLGASGDASRADPAMQGMVPRKGGWLAGKTPPTTLPGWIRDADIDFYASEFKRAGFSGGLNWYRNIDRNWELTAPWTGATVNARALYVVGDRDLVYRFRGMDQLVPNLRQFVPNLQDTIILAGCGHWTQQERAQEVNEAILAFLT